MKRFIIQIIIFLTFIAIGFVWLCTYANGYTDSFYVRFTTPKQENLILGTSRAAQGLQPQYFDSILGKKFFNYSFTIVHSPFGPTYLNSIKKKLSTNLNNATFIVAVDPWSLSSFNETPNDVSKFREIKHSLKKTPFVNLNPNPIYFFTSYNEDYKSLINGKKKSTFLHQNGWLQVNYSINDTLKVKNNIERKIATYKKRTLNTYFSSTRLEYLIKTISFLQKSGKVYLVRLPIHPKMMEIENQLMPNFDATIQKAIDKSDGYLDLTPKNDLFLYTDGNHLYKDSGKQVSKLVAKWIKTKNP